MPNTHQKDDGAKESSEQKANKRVWDEIESLFDSKKANAKQDRQEQDHANNRKEKKQKKPAHKTKPKRAIEMAKKDKNDDDWVDDGLGGRFNKEGFTGRVEDGVKVFKAHVLSKPNAGKTPQCPFDCDCCFI